MSERSLPPGLHRDTLAVRTALDRSQYGENSEALFLTSSFVQPDAETSARRFAGTEEGFTYTRTSNPTVASFERRLSELTDAALDEIAEFDPAVVRSPRRWARAAAAGVIAGAGAGTLVLVRARQQHNRREALGLKALNRGRHEVADHVRRRLER